MLGDDGNGYVGDGFMVQTNGLVKQGRLTLTIFNVRTNVLLRDPKQTVSYCRCGRQFYSRN